MLKKTCSLLGVMLAAGLIFIWCFSGQNRPAVFTNSNVKTTMDKQMIVLDPGHGGMDGGCVSVNGTAEKGINLAISNDLKDILTVMGMDVKCTRTTDVSIHDSGVEGTGKQKLSDMKNRLAIFNKYSGAISVSIHQNKFTDRAYSGAQMFYSNKNQKGEQLASCMQKQFVNLLQPDNTRETKGVGDELYLLNNTSCPAVMIECGFLSNPDEAAKLESESYQKQVSFTIMTGLFEFMGQDKS